MERKNIYLTIAMLATVLISTIPGLNATAMDYQLKYSTFQQSLTSDRPVGVTSLEVRSTSLEKLETDYESGKISIDQYLLYKAWSVFDPHRLPAEYALSSEESRLHRKRGTMIILEIKENWDSLCSETQDELDFVFMRPTDVDGGRDDKRHLLPKLYNTTNFIIHWTNGKDGGLSADAPDLTDSDSDGTPDYIEDFAEIFENVRSSEVTSLGFHAPPDDATQPDDVNRRNPDERYDIFVYNMSAYGYANPELRPDSPSCSYIGVDNDYIGFLTPPLQSMQVTAAHEFQHAIQFYYDCTEESWWKETTSTYMEDEVYPDVNDNYQYLPYWFQYCDFDGLLWTNGWHEYGNFIFAKRLSEDFGDDIIREIWEEMQTTNCTTAINNVLINKKSSFLEEFSRFVTANFFLEDMYVDGTDYREVLTNSIECAFNGVWLEYQYDASVEPEHVLIDDWNVNYNAYFSTWMDIWGTDYITMKLDPATSGYRIFFDGRNLTTNYLVKLVTKKSGVIAERTFTLDTQKDGYMNLAYDEFDNVTLIIANAGNIPTVYPSWRIIVEKTKTLTGDVDGDLDVDIYDVVSACLAFDSHGPGVPLRTPPDGNWNLNADFDNNNVVDIIDIVSLCLNFDTRVSETKVELNYDDGTCDNSYSWKAAGNMFAVRFTPTNSGLLEKCWFFIRDFPAPIIVHVMDADKNDMITPFTATPTSTGWFDVDLSTYGITVTENVDFYIAMESTAVYAPYLGVDTSNPDSRSWAFNIVSWEQLLLDDFMIRAVIETIVIPGPPLPPPETELQYDDGTWDNYYAWVSTGNMFAVRLTPTDEGLLKRCRFYIWDDPAPIIVHVMDADKNDMITPFTATPTSTGWFDVDLSTYGITVTENVDFYIAMESTVAFAPFLGADTSDPDGRSWDYDGTSWSQWSDDDYMIRAVIERV